MFVSTFVEPHAAGLQLDCSLNSSFGFFQSVQCVKIDGEQA